MNPTLIKTGRTRRVIHFCLGVCICVGEGLEMLRVRIWVCGYVWTSGQIIINSLKILILIFYFFLFRSRYYLNFFFIFKAAVLRSWRSYFILKYVALYFDLVSLLVPVKTKYSQICQRFLNELWMNYIGRYVFTSLKTD